MRSSNAFAGSIPLFFGLSLLVGSACASLDPYTHPLPPEVAVAPPPPSGERSEGEGFVRLDLPFPCGEALCAGWLYLPEGGAGPAPAVVMAHGFAGQRELGLPAFAEAFARAGFAAFLFDYRGWGASGGDVRYTVVTADQVEDYRAAMDFLKGRPEVDGEALALWGTSLSGGHVLLAAQGREDVRAIVSQIPMTHGSKGGSIHPEKGTGWPLVRLGFKDKLRNIKGEERLYITALGAGVAMVPGPQAIEAATALTPEGSTWPNLVAPDILLDFDEYHPHRVADEIAAPTLFVLGREDVYVSNDATEKTAASMENAEIHWVDGGHFDPYAMPLRGEVLDLEVAFLKRHLGGDPGESAPAP